MDWPDIQSLEVPGGGTLAWVPEQERAAHLSVARRRKTLLRDPDLRHPLEAKVQSVTKMIIQEVTAPEGLRVRDRERFNMPLLRFGA